VQVPELPARAQEAQVPVQAVVQQTPWEQIAELHSAATVHGCPIALRPQLAFTQVIGDKQSPSVLHMVLQALVAGSQVKGSQGKLVTAPHVPAPSQVRAGVSTAPVQLPATQMVPLA